MKSIKQITRSLEVRKVKLAKLRDELRELETDLSQYAENAESAYDDLEHCVDTLSMYL